MPDAIEIRGIQPLAWGTETVTGFVTTATTRDASTEEFTIKDEEGRIITQITGHGQKTEFTLEVIPKASVGTPPKPSQVLTVGSEKMVILNISKKRVQEDAEKWTVKGVQYPEIDLS